MNETKNEKLTTICVPISLHRRLTQLALEESIKAGKKIHIWELIEKKIKN